MSYTAVYTEFEALDPETGETKRHAPRILDRDAWRDEDWCTVANMSADTIRSKAVLDTYEDAGAYPTEEWRVIKGFKTWNPRNGVDADKPMREALRDDQTSLLGLEYNLERVGIEYAGLNGVWKDLFVAISEHTEPFACYHSPYEHDFADVTTIADGTDSVYYIEANNGQIRVEEQQFELVERDMRLDEWDYNGEEDGDADE